MLPNHPDPRCLRALRTKKLWLDGRATVRDLQFVSDAAWSAYKEHKDLASWHAWCTCSTLDANDLALKAARGVIQIEASLVRGSLSKSLAVKATREKLEIELENRLKKLRSHTPVKAVRAKTRWERLAS